MAGHDAAGPCKHVSPAPDKRLLRIMATTNKRSRPVKKTSPPSAGVGENQAEEQGPRLIAGARERVNKVVNPELAPPAATPRRAERRPEMIKQRREERMKAYERQRLIRQWSRIGGAIVGALLILGIGWTVWSQIHDARLNRVPEGTQNYQYAGGQHTQQPGETVAYTENPPVGGTHDPVWQNCGYYAAPVRSENAVHSMEHGAVWITYRPDLPQDQVDDLRKRAEDQTYILVSPYPNLPEGINVVASAWNHQLQLADLDDTKLDQFIRKFRQSLEAPEPGSSCTGGTDATV